MRHAVLVMAHGNLSVLQKCMEILDDERFDFFIHMDAKSADDGRWLQDVCQKSHVHFTERIPVYWGDCTQTKAAVLLLKSALGAQTSYSYYHLISAVDMPLKTSDEIDWFFTHGPVETEYVTTRGGGGAATTGA